MNETLKFVVENNEDQELIEYLQENDKVDWHWISRYQKLSEPFIEKFQDKVDWHCISRCQKLSEPFIEKFQDKVDWNCILGYQKLSEPFIEKFQDKVDLEIITKQKQAITYELLERLNACQGGKQQFKELYGKTGNPTLKDLIWNDKVDRNYICWLYNNL